MKMELELFLSLSLSFSPPSRKGVESFSNGFVLFFELLEKVWDGEYVSRVCMYAVYFPCQR